MGKGEVNGNASLGAGNGTATVDQPIQQTEGEVVAKPDDGTGGEQMWSGVRKALWEEALRVVDMSARRGWRRQTPIWLASLTWRTLLTCST